MSTTEPLLPCPFCGGEAETRTNFVHQFAICKDCLANSDYLNSEDEAIAAWNRRATPPAPDQDGTIYANLLSVIADIRAKTGVGAKPMLSELADAVAAKISAAPHPVAWRWRTTGETIWVHVSEKPEVGKYFDDSIVLGRDVEVEPLFAHPATVGWVMVPRDPTASMLDKGESVIINGCTPEDLKASPRATLAYALACYRAMISAAPAAPNGWQPIETAPKDGTSILTFPHYKVTHWIGEPDDTYPEPGWADYWDDGLEKWITTRNPTHWMPLPAAPTEARDE